MEEVEKIGTNFKKIILGMKMKKTTTPTAIIILVLVVACKSDNET